MKTMMSVLLLSASVYCTKMSKTRNPRLFWVSSTTSTSTTTSTLSTNTLCFVTGNMAISTACKRKRRFINFDPLLGKGTESEIQASLINDESKHEDMVDEIDSGKDDNSEDDKTAERQAKFLLYWMTTTLTSTSTTTSTSFSSTQTLTLTVCTPTTVIATCG
eukprot:TRINITY_DN439_c0_g1_i1.p1 TRINITY_DN439_c0_g1~~TRINITY_DN439_c0_g1_i1.p1  ORF type:complete len:162 (+),score=32.34 TRINITY_DN439_c0_g1_i1:52-537(+)